MKIAVLSDIHGNRPALEAVLDDIAGFAPEAVVVNGDLVNRGPYSRDCLHRLREAYPAARYIRGNHETYVLACADAPGDPAARTHDMRRFADWTVRQLGDDLAVLRGWPEHLDFADPAGGQLHLTHGTRLGNRDGIHSDTSDAELPDKLGDPRDLFVTGHTHKPLLRRFGATLIVNVGSVGAPFDGDHRAAYARLVFAHGEWQAEIRRVAFDVERALRDFDESGFLAASGPFATLMALELRHARPLCGGFMRKWHEHVRTGELSVAAAVARYREESGLAAV